MTNFTTTTESIWIMMALLDSGTPQVSARAANKAFSSTSLVSVYVICMIKVVFITLASKVFKAPLATALTNFSELKEEAVGIG